MSDNRGLKLYQIGGKKMTIDEKINKCIENIKGYEEILKIMPEETIIGRLCVLSYIKRETRKLESLCEQKGKIT